MLLENKIAMVTAAAGAGIGQATARGMAQEGAKIIVTDAHPERPKSVAEQISKDFGVEAIGFQCDVSDSKQVNQVVQESLVRFGRIDILFNNAGINKLAKVADMTDENWQKTMAVCLNGTFYTCRAVLPSMVANNFGRIVNVSSVAGFKGLGDGQSHYSAAKAGIMAFTRCLAMEYAGNYITANCIAPGFINNEFLARIYPPEAITRMNDDIPYPRKGQPKDIASIAVFLCSDLGEYVTGQTICAAGGTWMH